MNEFIYATRAKTETQTKIVRLYSCSHNYDYAENRMPHPNALSYYNGLCELSYIFLHYEIYKRRKKLKKEI